jgi:hypothetical protein
MSIMSATKIYKPSSKCIEELKNDLFCKDIGSAREFSLQRIEVASSNRLSTLKDSLSSIEILAESVQELNHKNNMETMTSYILVNKIDNCNRVAISFKTVKYAVILLVVLILTSYLFFLFVIGVMNLKKCSLENNIPIYLLVIGLAGKIFSNLSS